RQAIGGGEGGGRGRCDGRGRADRGGRHGGHRVRLDAADGRRTVRQAAHGRRDGAAVEVAAGARGGAGDGAFDHRDAARQGGADGDGGGVDRGEVRRAVGRGHRGVRRIG